jgi:hypothetical protein
MLVATATLMKTLMILRLQIDVIALDIITYLL